MQFPSFIRQFPSLDLPFPDDVVRSHAIRSEAGLVVFFDFLADVELPPHSHLAQWGVLVDGEIELTIAGQTRSFRPGEHWDISPGVEHSVRIRAGAKAIDVFEEPDRYPLR